MITHPYKHTHVYSISISTFERLVELILRFTKSVTKSVSMSMGTLPPTEKIINHKYNIHIKSRI
jgi:hypothetical protein